LAGKEEICHSNMMLVNLSKLKGGKARSKTRAGSFAKIRQDTKEHYLMVMRRL
jgi:hypothetical protein